MKVSLYEKNVDMPDPRPNPDGGQVGGGFNPRGFIANIKVSVIYSEEDRLVEVIAELASRGNTLTSAFLSSAYIKTHGADRFWWDQSSSTYFMAKVVPFGAARRVKAVR